MLTHRLPSFSSCRTRTPRERTCCVSSSSWQKRVIRRRRRRRRGHHARSTSALSASGLCWVCARAMRLWWRPASSFSSAGGRARCSRSTFNCCEPSSRPQPPPLRLPHSPLHLHLHPYLHLLLYLHLHLLLHRAPRIHLRRPRLARWTSRPRALELSTYSRQPCRRPPASSSPGGRSQLSARM